MYIMAFKMFILFFFFFIEATQKNDIVFLLLV